MTDPAELNLDDLRRRARRRLIGAIVLALAAAVVVPMLLESEPRPLGEDVTVKIPQVDDGKFVNQLQGKNKAPLRSEGTKAGPARSDVAKAEPPKDEPAPADTPKTGSSDAAPSKSAAAEGMSRAEPAAATRNADPLKRSLAEAEQKVLAAPAKAPSAAPAAAKAAPAEAPKAPPTAASPAPRGATEASKPAGATFSVQLAAFSDDKGANALANKLKRAGHSAYTEPLETSKGTLWRVRVGPFPTRDEAVAAREALKGEGQVGIVAPSR